jgi:Na+-transporting methylmalonyl-CoA/oxaloacetate decarboxylase gamma subunit
MSKKISNVALLTFEGAAFNVTFLALLLILVYLLTMVLKLTYFKIAIDHASHLLLHKNMAL